MGRTRVVTIGISRVSDGSHRPLPFAAADAERFAQRVGASAMTRVLIDADASCEAVRAALKELGTAGPGDTLYIFIVGVVDAARGDVELACFDGTTSLGDALHPVWSGPAARVVLLLDCYRDGARPGAVLEQDVVARFPIRAGRAVLVSDDGNHGSHVSGELQGGVWAAHVTAAFAGDDAREPNGALTAGSLRAWLEAEIPRSLARAYANRRRQSPVILATSGEEILAEPAAPRVAKEASPAGLAGVCFFSEHQVPVKLLGGFRKSLHTPPADTLASSREWVTRLAEPDLAKDLEDTVARLRRHLGYKRRDLRADGPAGGAASVLTPDFAYHVTVRQHEELPSQAVFRRALGEIRNLDVLGRPAFVKAFPGGFLSLHYPFDTPAAIASFIDRVEDSEPAAVRGIDYPTDLAWCELELAGFAGRVRIEPAGMTVIAPGPAPPPDLAMQFSTVRGLLRGAS
jgi:hypothetical protein